MDQRDSHCPYLLSSETTAKGFGSEHFALSLFFFERQVCYEI